MDRERTTINNGPVVLAMLLIVALVSVGCVPIEQAAEEAAEEVLPVTQATATQAPTAVPTLTAPPAAAEVQPTAPQPTAETQAQAPQVRALQDLYDQINPGVVSIQVIVERTGTTGSGAGSGFILDEEGHIITNSHVVAQAENIIVVFYDGFQAKAEVVGTDADSDLAVLNVDELAEGAHPLPLADSDAVQPGDAAIAIGNPFGQQGSMTSGIVSAVGRVIPSLAEGFSIPQAIQTDAAINPGNSGGPLLNAAGKVIGVNAQIRSSGARANSGVGFAVPSNIVRRVAPVLIEEGSYTWPWLGITGPPTGVNLYIAQANDLDSQRGAYIHQVIEDGPAAEAGLQGSTGTTEIDGIEWPVGGDIVVETDGEPIVDFADLLVSVAFKRPGDTMDLTIIRDGERQQVTVELEARPEDFEQSQ